MPDLSDVLTSEGVFNALHRFLACVRSGQVVRVRTQPSGWAFEIAGRSGRSELLRWGFSVLDVDELIAWWPGLDNKEYASLTPYGADQLREWDAAAVFDEPLCPLYLTQSAVRRRPGGLGGDDTE